MHFMSSLLYVTSMAVPHPCVFSLWIYRLFQQKMEWKSLVYGPYTHMEIPVIPQGATNWNSLAVLIYFGRFQFCSKISQEIKPWGRPCFHPTSDFFYLGPDPDGPGCPETSESNSILYAEQLS